jgi:arylformamidase
MARIDVSVPIESGMVTYEGDPAVEITERLSIAKGDPANVRHLALGSHTGTHIDAPSHFIDGGRSLDEVPLDALIGPVVVVESDAAPLIGARECEALVPRGTDRVVFKTRNSRLWAQRRFSRDYVAIDESAARWLVERRVRLAAIDYLSIEAFGATGHPVHRTLLGANIVILEGLDLSAVSPGRYDLICLPLRIAGGDGAPCRALLEAAAR